jgi:hypothetical protein
MKPEDRDQKMLENLWTGRFPDGSPSNKRKLWNALKILFVKRLK